MDNLSEMEKLIFQVLDRIEEKVDNMIGGEKDEN